MGLLKKLSPSTPGVDHLLYAVPAGKRAVVTLNISSRANSAVSVGLAVMDTLDVAVGSVAVVTKGQGYTAIPAVVVAGDCTTAAEFTVDNMTLAGLSVSAAGEKYVVDEVLTLAVTAGVATTVAKAKVTSVSETGGITGIEVMDGGVYTTIKAVATISATTGVGVGATFEALNWGVNAVSLKKAGNGYKTNPMLTIPGGTGAALSTQMVRIVESDDFFEPETTILKSQPLERTGIALSEGQSLYIRPSVGGLINAHVWGIEALG